MALMINNLLRAIQRDNPAPRVVMLRLAPLVIGLPLIMTLWAIYGRDPLPPSGIRGDTNALPVPVDVGAVSVGSLVQGALSVNERHAWTLAATKGQRISVAAFSAWDNSVSVIMPDSGPELMEDGFSGGNGQGRIAGVTLPVEGTYRIVVSGEKGGAGNYELVVSEAPPATSGTLTKVGPSDGPLLITR